MPARSFESLLEDGSVGCSLSWPGDNQGTSPGWCHPCPKPSSLGTAQLLPFFHVAHFPAPHPGACPGPGRMGRRPPWASPGCGVTRPVLDPATLGQEVLGEPCRCHLAKGCGVPSSWRAGMEIWSLGFPWEERGGPGVRETLAQGLGTNPTKGRGLGTDQLPQDAPSTFPGWMWRPGVVLVVVAAVPSSRCAPGSL